MFPRELISSDACVGVQAVKSSADPSTGELGYNTLSNPFFDKNLSQGSYFTTSLILLYHTEDQSFKKLCCQPCAVLPIFTRSSNTIYG